MNKRKTIIKQKIKKTKNKKIKKDITIYFSQDLEHVFVTQTYTETFLHDLVDGSLEVFDDLLVHLDSNNRFIKAANSHVIVDSFVVVNVKFTKAIMSFFYRLLFFDRSEERRVGKGVM